jgi:hypothetical protein
LPIEQIACPYAGDPHLRGTSPRVGLCGQSLRYAGR